MTHELEGKLGRMFEIKDLKVLAIEFCRSKERYTHNPKRVCTKSAEFQLKLIQRWNLRG